MSHRPYVYHSRRYLANPKTVASSRFVKSRELDAGAPARSESFGFVGCYTLGRRGATTGKGRMTATEGCPPDGCYCGVVPTGGWLCAHIYCGLQPTAAAARLRLRPRRLANGRLALRPGEWRGLRGQLACPSTAPRRPGICGCCRSGPSGPGRDHRAPDRRANDSRYG